MNTKITPPMRAMFRAMTSAANAFSLRHMDELNDVPLTGRRVIMTMPVAVLEAWEIMAEASATDRADYIRQMNTIAAIAHQTHPELRGLPPFLVDMAERDFLEQMIDRWIKPQCIAQQRDPSLLEDMTLRTITGTLCMPEDDNAHWSLCQIRSDDGLRFTLPTAFLSCRPLPSVEDERLELCHPDVSLLAREHGRNATREFVTTLMRPAIEKRNPQGTALFEVLHNVDSAVRSGLLKNGDVISVDVDATARQRTIFNMTATLPLVEKSIDVVGIRASDIKGLLMLDDLSEYFPSSWIDAYKAPRNLSHYTFRIKGQTQSSEIMAIREEYSSIRDVPHDKLAKIINDLTVVCVETGEEMAVPSGIVTDSFVTINGLSLAKLAESRNFN